MSFIVLGLRGVAGSGKDTAALFLAQHGFRRVAFADALKAEVAAAFGVSLELLDDRKTKEVPLPELALANCQDRDFIQVMRKVCGHSLNLQAPKSPRHIMQHWGTEYRRSQNLSYWIDKVLEKIKPESSARWVVTDVRNMNEVAAVESLGGEVFEVVMEGAPPSWGACSESKGHISEVELNGMSFPVLRNQYGDRELLHSEIERSILNVSRYRREFSPGVAA